MRRSRRLREAPHRRAAAAAGVAPEDGAKLETGPGDDVEAPGEGELVARVAALKASLAETEADVARVAAELRATEARAEREREEVAKAEDALVWYRMRQDPAWRDWAGGLPDEVLATVAEKVVAQTEAGWAARLKEWGFSEEDIPERLAEMKRDGNCLFVFARVCKGWRKAQLKVGDPLRTRVYSDVIAPGSVTLVKWALAEGCPRERGDGFTMAEEAAFHGNLELVKWLCGEGGFTMDVEVMLNAAGSGNFELVRWLRGEGCPWDLETCWQAVDQGHVEVLRWARENGCEWDASTRDKAAEKLGYTDDLGNLLGVDEHSDEDPPWYSVPVQILG